MIGTVNRNPSPKDLRSFGVVMLCGLGVIGCILWYAGGAEGSRWSWNGGNRQVAAVVLWIVGSLVLATSLAAPAVARIIYIAWMSVAIAIGTVMVPFFLTILYFTLLAPFSLIRLKDPLRKKLLASGSYWEDHPPHAATIDRMLRPF